MATSGQVKVWNSVEENGENEAVWLTQHSDGMDLPDIVRRALKRSAGHCLGDSPYLTRMIFCQMMMEDGLEDDDGRQHAERLLREVLHLEGTVKGWSGFGICGYDSESEYTVILDHGTQTATVAHHGQTTFDGDWDSFVEGLE